MVISERDKILRDLNDALGEIHDLREKLKLERKKKKRWKRKYLELVRGTKNECSKSE